MQCPLKRISDWKLATPRGKMQGDRLKLLILFTYLKCRLCHCCLAVAPCFTQHGSQSHRDGLGRPSVLLTPRAVTSFPLAPLARSFSSHMASPPFHWLSPSPDQGMANSFPLSSLLSNHLLSGVSLTALFHMETSSPVYLSH